MGKAMRGTAITTTAIVFLISCQDDLTPKRLSSEDQSKLAAEDNAQLMLATQEALDVTAGGLEDKGVAEGRTKHGDHDNYGCAPAVNVTLNIDRNHQDSIVYSGTLSLNYGDGASCDAKNKRTGKITDTFKIVVRTKAPYNFTSSETLTFEAFTRDSTTYNGNIVVIAASNKKATVAGNAVSIEYADGTTSSWNGTFTFAYEDVSKRKGEIQVTGGISGVSRQGVSYESSIIEPVVFKPGCYGWIKKIPVDGLVKITTNGSTSNLNYGNGACDRIYTIEVDGETEQHSFD